MVALFLNKNFFSMIFLSLFFLSVNAVSCFDLNFQIVSSSGVVDESGTDVSISVICFNALVEAGENINLNKVDFFDAGRNLLGSKDLSPSTCSKNISSPTIFIQNFSGVDMKSFSYDINYGGTFGGKTISCLKNGVVVSKKATPELNIPDANFFSIIIVLLIVISIAVINSKKI